MLGDRDYGALSTTYGGKRLWDQPIDAELQAIASPAEQDCVVATDGFGFGPTYARSFYLTVDGGRVWCSPKLPVPNVVLWGVSCPDASECLAVGSDSEGAVVLASFDGGRHCSVQAIPGMPPSVAYETVQCTAPRHCVVLGRGSVAALAVSSQAGGRVAAACRRA
ncbi:MAG: hypothetical protein ABSD85_12360 [Acidimicrobiales bacterium]